MAQEKRINPMNRISGIIGFFTILLLGAMNQPSYALQLNQYPDIRLIDVTANQAPGSFATSGAMAETFYGRPNIPTSLYNSALGSYAYFDLSAQLDTTTGALLSGGNFAIYDDSDGDGFYTSINDYLYLSGDLTAKDFTATTYEFLFSPTGGYYQADYGTVGHINISMAGDGDVRTPVPEPSTVSLLLLGAGGLCFLRRRKSQS
jgi:hypothetical protein